MLRILTVLLVSFILLASCKKTTDDSVPAKDPGASWKKVGNYGLDPYGATVYKGSLFVHTSMEGLTKIDEDGNVLRTTPFGASTRTPASGFFQPDYYVTNLKFTNDSFYTCFNSYNSASNQLQLKSNLYKIPGDTTKALDATFSVNLDSTAAPAMLVLNGNLDNYGNAVPAYYSIAFYSVQKDVSTDSLMTVSLDHVYSLADISSSRFEYSAIYALKNKYLVNGFNTTYVVYSDGSHRKVADNIIRPLAIRNDTIYGAMYQASDEYYTTGLYYSLDGEHWALSFAPSYANDLILVGNKLVTYKSWLDVVDVSGHRLLHPDMTGVDLKEIWYALVYNKYLYVINFEGDLYRKKVSYFSSEKLKY